jgi:hypothetical protein
MTVINKLNGSCDASQRITLSEGRGFNVSDTALARPSIKEAHALSKLTPHAGKAKIEFAVHAADAPYKGKGKLNQAKSHLTGETGLIEKTPDGRSHFRQDNQGAISKLDGTE